MKKLIEEIFCDKCSQLVSPSRVTRLTDPDGRELHFCDHTCLRAFFYTPASKPAPVIIPPVELKPGEAVLDTKAAARYVGKAPNTLHSALRRGLLTTLGRDAKGSLMFTTAALDAYKNRIRTRRTTPKALAPAPVPPAVPARQVLGYKTLPDGRPLFNEQQAAEYLGFATVDTVRSYVSQHRLTFDMSCLRKPGGKLLAYFFLPSTLEKFKLDVRERYRQRGLKAFATATARGTSRLPKKGVPVGVTGFAGPDDAPPSEKRADSETSH